MYIPDHFVETDLVVLHDLIRSQPLGTWVMAVGGRLMVNHLPFVLDTTQGPLGTLRGHVARKNEAWRAAPGDVESVVVFQGPQAYISPSWYPAKAEHGKVVPTWNYAVVHAHGTPRVVDDAAWLRAHVSELTDTHESGRDAPWRVADAPDEFVDSLLRGVVGIEIPIATLDGKWKVSQNRSMPDRVGVAEGLTRLGDPDARRMARLVAERADQGGR